MEIAVGARPESTVSERSDAVLHRVLAHNAVLLGVAEGFGVIGACPTAFHALELVSAYLHEHRMQAFGATPISEETPRTALLAALEYANARLYAAGGSNEDFIAGGASLTVVLLVERHAFVGHIGDARAYRLRFGTLEMLTTDDAWFTPTRGVLWRSLGTHEKLEANVRRVDVLAGDQLLLCTNGIHAAVSAEEMRDALMESHRACDASARLAASAKARGGLENGAVITARDLTVFPGAASTVRRGLSGGKRLCLSLASALLAFALIYALCR